MSEVVRRLTEHPDAPRFNHRAGDRLHEADRDALAAWAEGLDAARLALTSSEPPPAVLARFAGLRGALAERVAPALRGDWSSVPTSGREEVALRLDRLVPDDAPLGELIVYRTAGTTGHALLVPHHARAVAAYLPLLQTALRRRGVEVAPQAPEVAAFLLGAQQQTVTLATSLSLWGGAGFAKLNLRHGEWPREGSAARYLDAMAPTLLTGDPLTFAEALTLPLAHRPAAVVSTAVAMGDGLRRRIAASWQTVVLDWYSLTETGPVAYRCEAGAWHVLPPDLHVELLGGEDDGGRGEITLSGGRNPFLPLIRYRTGDWARWGEGACACGDPARHLVDLQGRAPVLLRSAGGEVVNPVDVSRALRELPIVQHRLVQAADRSLLLVVRPIPGVALREDAVRDVLTRLFGALAATVTVDPSLGDRGKPIPYVSDLWLED